MAQVAASYGSLPFAEQIAFFRRKLNYTTLHWTDVWQDAHDHGFMVAGANRDDLLTDFREAIDKAISQGTTLEEFRRDFDSIVAKHGWSYNGGRNWRSRVIYETNLRTSYNAGRWAQAQEGKKWRPFVQYEHDDAVEHPRPIHVTWNGLILHIDDPWVATHWTPNGWGCQCRWRTLAARDLKRLGKTGPDKAPDEGTEVVTIGKRGVPRQVETPVGVDPGFGYAPGKSAYERQLAEQAERAMQAEAYDSAPGVWTRMDTSTWQEYGRPERMPLAPLPVPLGPHIPNVDEMRTAIEAIIGGPQRIFDLIGRPLAIDAAVLASHIDLQRAEYLPLLPDLISDPYEVWVSIDQHTSGLAVVRSRIIKGYDIGGGRMLMLVAQAAKGLLESWTFIPTRDRKYINRQRAGLLWFGK